MKLSNHATVPVYTISGSSTSRPLPEWLARKRKRSLKSDPEYTSRIELLQDFEFEEASQCVRVSEDGSWVMSTGTYKPQIHTHYLPNLALSFARHTVSLNTTFELLSTDYSKSVHLQADRALEFHTPEGCRYSTRIPRYGRDLKYSKKSTEALIPAAGVNETGHGEVFRLNLEHGRFMRSYEVDVGGDDLTSVGAGSLQGGIHAGSVNTAAIAEESHGLLAFGTSLGTVEYWDPRVRERVGILQNFSRDLFIEGRQETTALEFEGSGLSIACGSSTGMINVYDLRSPLPLITKDQGYGSPIKSLIFLTPSSSNRVQSDETKILSADKRIIKIWGSRTGNPWTSVEPAVDLNAVAWCKDSGMILTANEGRQQHAFLIPQLGPAPRWCSFLDNLVEEMAEDAEDPNAFTPGVGEVYENYKFLTHQQLESLNLAHLIGTTTLLRPYMHGFFVAQKLYEEARIIADPFVLEDQRMKKLKEKLEKERESRIRGSKKLPGKVNRALADKILARTEQNDPQDPSEGDSIQNTVPSEPEKNGQGLLTDPRFSKLFTDKAYAIDQSSKEFQDLNPGTKVPAQRERNISRSLTAMAKERDENDNGETVNSDNEELRGASDLESSSAPKFSNKSAKQNPPQASLLIRNSTQTSNGGNRSFRSRAFGQKRDNRRRKDLKVVGEQETSFVPSRPGKKEAVATPKLPAKGTSRRSASGNVFRAM